VTARRSDDARTAVGRSLFVLGAFDESHPSLTLSQIGRRAQLPLPTTHRLVAELVGARLVTRSSDGAYSIGARLWRLGLLSAPTTLREVAQPHLQDLVATTGHTVHLAVLEASRAMVVERLSGTRTVSTRHRPGALLPLHCTAIGKALLSYAGDDVLRDVLANLAQHTPFTITDPRVLSRQLAEVRRTGVARSAQEHRLGVSSLAVPVFGDAGSVVAAVAVIAPLTSPRITESVPPMMAAAGAIAEGLRRQRLAAELQ
jgi:DNA-binding IclR family transcriptional regulator